MEIEIGEYVRINNDFRLIALGIGKVIKINQDTIYVKMNFELPFAFKLENIAKHSKNLIYLVEDGDYVNGYKIIAINYKENYITIQNINEFDENGIKVLQEDEIKTILTKEQMKANCYTVERKEEC